MLFPKLELTSASSSLHPLELALNLPRSSTQSVLTLLHRQLTAISTTSSATWLHSRFLALYAAALMVSTEPDAFFPPDGLWEHSLKIGSAMIQKAKNDKVALARVARYIDGLTQWVTVVIRARKEELKSWTGSSAWSQFTDCWINVARKVRASICR